MTQNQTGVLATGTGASGVILSFTAASPVTVRAVDIKFENAVRASNDITVEIRRGSTVLATQVIYGYGSSMNAEGNPNDYKYRDVARHNWTRLAAPLAAGETLTVVITAGALPPATSLRATAYERLPTKPFAGNLDFMLPSLFEAPISNDNFPVMPTAIAVGNEIPFDPRSHVQNNSNIIRNPYNGRLIAVPAFFTIDEQKTGGNQTGLKSRLYLYQSKPYGNGTTLDAQGNPVLDWEEAGILVDLDPNSTDQTQYVGDAHLSYDAEGNVICIFNTVNGINDVTTRTGLSVKWIKLDKTTGAWSRPATLYHFEYNQTPEWVYCPRLVYDATARKYLLVLNIWNGANNRHFRALRLDSLSQTLTATDIRNAPVIIMNNEEGGGMWKVGGEVFISTWQVPSLNSPRTRQAIYRAPLAEAHLPGAWKPFAHSGARNEPNNPFQAGGFTADACNFWVEESARKIYRTCVGWSADRAKNYLVWSQSDYDRVWREDAATFACPLGETQVTPTIDIPFAGSGSFEFTLKPINGGTGPNANTFMLYFGQLYVQVLPGFIGIGYGSDGGQRFGSTDAAGFKVGVPVKLRVVRESSTFTLYVNDVQRATGTINSTSAPIAFASINNEATRWFFQGFTESEYEVSGVTMLDSDAPAPTPTPTPTLTPTLTPTPTPTSTRTNYALASNGGQATASSEHSSGFYPSGATINGDRKGSNWGTGGGWNDATDNTYPDWLQVDFNGSKTINEISVFTLQDDYNNPVEPTESLTFSIHGVRNFDVQYWNGSAWTTVPTGSITNNNKVWNKVTFSDITTTKIRVLVNNALNNYSRLVEVEAWGGVNPTPTPIRTNYALTSNGGTASASSEHSSGFYPSGATINGDRKGSNWSAGGGWNDATADSYPDWLQMEFNGSKTINEISVFTLQDDYNNPVEPTESLTFSYYGIKSFDVQYWNGSSWVTISNGSITNNNKIWNKITFPAVTTTKVRVLVNDALAGYSRIVEVEAWGAQ